MPQRKKKEEERNSKGKEKNYIPLFHYSIPFLSIPFILKYLFIALSVSQSIFFVLCFLFDLYLCKKEK